MKFYVILIMKKYFIIKEILQYLNGTSGYLTKIYLLQDHISFKLIYLKQVCSLNISFQFCATEIKLKLHISSSESNNFCNHLLCFC